jgi:hypothetical protein
MSKTSAKRQRYIDHLVKVGKWLSPTELAKALKEPKANVSYHLNAALAFKLVQVDGKGNRRKFAAPDVALPGGAIEAAAAAPKTNPRKRFDKTAQDELTDSVKKLGVLQPILVRPTAAPRQVRARRRRAPLPRREGRRPGRHPGQHSRAHRRRGPRGPGGREPAARGSPRARGGRGIRAAPQVRARRREEVHRRGDRGQGGQEPQLRLRPPQAHRALPRGAQGVLRRRPGRVEGLLIARIGHHDTQRQALKDLTKGSRYGREPMSYREAHQHILQNYMLQLKERALRHQGRPAGRQGRRLRQVPEEDRQPGRSLRRREECRRLHGPEMLRRQAPGALLRGGEAARGQGQQGHRRRRREEGLPALG